MKVYVAAPLLQLARALRAARELERRGVEVVSHWHDELFASGAPIADADHAGERRRALAQNRADLTAAHAALVLTDDECGRSTYAEVGEMVRMGKPIVWSAERGGRCLYDSAPGVLVVETDDEAIASLAGADTVREMRIDTEAP